MVEATASGGGLRHMHLGLRGLQGLGIIREKRREDAGGAMQLGVMVEGQEGLTWDLWRRITALVEDLGFESLWRSDHFMSLVDPARQSLEAWTSLTLTAVDTSRLRFGPLVCPMTFRHPALLARMAAALDTLSGGRFVLGVGAGWNEVEHRTFGIPFPPFTERMAMLVEGIEVIRRLLAGKPASFTGAYYRLDGAEAHPAPAQTRLPLVIGGKGERRVLPVVARYADEWNLTGATPAEYRAKSARLEECCRTAGRDPAAIARSVMTGFLIWRDPAEFRRRCGAVQRLFPSLGGLTNEEVPAAVRQWGWMTGTPDTVVAYLTELERAGVQRVMLQHHVLDDDDALALIAREVLPAVS